MNNSNLINSKKNQTLSWMQMNLKLSNNNKICSTRLNIYLSGALEEKMLRYAPSSILGRERRWIELFLESLSRELD